MHFSNRESTFAADPGSLFENNYETSINLDDLFENFVSLQEAKSEWICNLDTIDLQTARWFYSGQMLTMGPFLGARFGWLNQRFNLSSLPIDATDFVRSNHRSKSWFAGPRAGIDMNWILGYGLRATGSLAGSLLYQRQRATTSGTITETENGVLVTQPLDLKNTYRHVRTQSEMGLGLGWGTYLAEDAFHIDFLAAYEFHLWAKQNVMRSSIDSSYRGFSPPGDLMYQGLTLTMRIDF